MRRDRDSVRVRRLRAKYRKRMWVVAVVFLLIGLAVGLYLGYTLFGGDFEGFGIIKSNTDVNAAPTPVIDVTPTPTAVIAFENAQDPVVTATPVANVVSTDENYTIDLPDPTATPEPTPTPAPTVKAVVPFGDSYTFTTQINSDGSMRVSNGEGAYETLSFTVTMKQFMRPSDYANKYSNMYKLQGTEAGAGFEIILNDYTGVTSIVPQNMIAIGFESATGNTFDRGYQLMDAEIGGNHDITVTSNTPKRLYKRYLYSSTGEEMEYMTINCYNNGVAEKIMFELEGTEAKATPAPTVGLVTDVSIHIDGKEAGDGVAIVSEGMVQFDWGCQGDVDSYYVYVRDAGGTSLLKGEGVSNTTFEVHSSRMTPGEVYTLTIGALPVNGTDEDIVWRQVLFMLPAAVEAKPTRVPEPDPTEAPPTIGLVTGVTINVGGISVGSTPIAIDTDNFQISWDGGDEVASYSYQIKDENEKVIVRMENTDLTGLLVNASVLKSGTVYTITVGALPVNGTEDDIVWNRAQFMLAESAGMDGESLAVRQSLMKSTAEAIVYRTSNGKWYHLNASCSGMSGGKPYALRDCAAMKACTKCGAPDASLLMAVCEWVDEGGICHVSDDCPAFEGNYSLVPVEEAAKNNPVYCAVCASESFSG